MFSVFLRLLRTALGLTGIVLLISDPARAATGTATVGQAVTFTVTAAGTPPFTYQWTRGAATITGATAATYVIARVQLADAATYGVVVANAAGVTSADNAVLTVMTTGSAPVFTTQPVGRTVVMGATVNLVGEASGSPAPAYQWQLDGVDIPMATGTSYTVTNIGPGNAGTYAVVATNTAGSTASQGAVLTVNTAPTIVAGPESQRVSATAQFYSIAVTANGSWTASSSEPWATVSPAGGKGNGSVTVTVAANTSAGVRSAIITVAGKTSVLFQTGTETVIITLPLTVTTLAGFPLSKGSIDGIGSSARFYYPTGIAADNAGNLYVSDTENNTIRVIAAATGEVSTVAGSAANPGSTDGVGSAALFNKPSGIAVENVGVAIDSEGNVFIADTLNHTLRKITAARAVSTIAGLAGQSGYADGTGASARFQGPQGLAFCRVASATGTESDLFIADTNNQTIRKINLSNGLVTTVAGMAGESGSADGMRGSARFNAPTDLAVDNNGILFVADSENHTIREILPSGLVSTLAGQALNSGSADGIGTAARFNSPSAVAVDLSHNVFVADTDNNTIRMIIPLTGAVSTLAGLAGASGTADGLGSAARFYNPTGITADGAGSLYISDTNNHTIRVGLLPSMPSIQVQPHGVSTAAGANAQFSVSATGRPKVTYQWYFNDAAITGATSDVYSLPGVQSGNAGSYTVVVSNLVGFVTSTPATLAVDPAPASSGGTSGGAGIPGGGGQGGAPSAWFDGGLLLLVLIRRFRKPSVKRATTWTTGGAGLPGIQPLAQPNQPIK